MADLQVQLQNYFPNNAIASLMDDLVNVKGWDDFQRRFLMGTGKSKNTYRSYLESCKQFFDFTDGQHPMACGTPEWIESWYDSLKVDLNTKALRIRGLKYMYTRICERFPFYTSPFEIMTENLKQKLGRSKKDESQKGALTEREYQALLRLLRNDNSLRGVQDYAIIRFGTTSGMRAAELCGLRWENIEKTEAGGYTATFCGKGAKVRTIQMETEAVRAARRAFRARYNRKPAPADLVFHSLPCGRAGKEPGILPATLYNRVQAIAEVAKGAGIIRQNLKVTPHIMRHSCATRLLAAGVPIDVVQKHLGHSNINTTQTYLHNEMDLTAVFSKIAGEGA